MIDNESTCRARAKYLRTSGGIRRAWRHLAIDFTVVRDNCTEQRKNKIVIFLSLLMNTEELIITNVQLSLTIVNQLPDVATLVVSIDIK